MAKFELGDKVKVVKLDCNWVDWCDELANYIGRTGIIKRFYFREQGVQFEDGMRWNFPEDWLELVEKAKMGCDGQVFIVDKDTSVELEAGKVYDVKDGYLMNGGRCYNLMPYSSIKDLLTWLAGHDRPHIQAIEFKGFADQE